MADRYARLHYNYTGDFCGWMDRAHKPSACVAGADQAQFSATMSNLAMSVLSLLCNPVLGSWSDSHGRKPVLLLSLSACVVPAIVLVGMLHNPSMPPVYYYSSNALTGVVQYLSVVFAALSDLLPWRAEAYGVVLAGFYGGYSLAPTVPLLVSHLVTAVVSLTLLLLAWMMALVWLPETLVSTASQPTTRVPVACPPRPLQDMSILNTNLRLRIIAAASLFSSMVYASDVTLVMYYMEENLNVQDRDVAVMFWCIGITGILVQGFLLQPMVQAVGETRLLIVTFFSGTLHNLLYGVATNKFTMLCALVLSQLTKVNVPLLSSLAASAQGGQEQQGRIQGALFAVNALGYAIGPLSMEAMYHQTKDTIGPGFMFVYAAALYATGTVIVSFLPDLHLSEIVGEATGREALLQEPLLSLDEPEESETSEEPPTNSSIEVNDETPTPVGVSNEP